MSIVPDAFNQEPRLVFSLTKVCFVGELLDAGFRPCRRGPLVSTKGPKTMYAEHVQQLEVQVL